MGGKKQHHIHKNHHKATFADIMPQELIEKSRKLCATPKMQEIATRTNKKIIDSLILSKGGKKSKIIDTLVLAQDIKSRCFENSEIDFMTIKKAKELAREMGIKLNLGYKGKKLLGYMKKAKNLPRNQRFFEIKKNDRFVYPDGGYYLFDGERFTYYTQEGEVQGTCIYDAGKDKDSH